MGIVSGFLRREMKARTEEILVSVQGVKDSLDKHTEVLEKLLARLEAENPICERGEKRIAAELRKTTGSLVKSERKLVKSVANWTGFMEQVVAELR